MNTRPATTPVRRAAIANLGCKVNQAEMDAVERLLRGHGVDLLEPHEPADLIVVNTCTVTGIADRKSRQAVRRARRNNPSARLLVTGCSVAIDPEAFAAADPSARLFDNDAKGELLAELAALLETSGGRSPAEPVEDDLEARTAVDRTRVFVKIGDGCSFHCTYCLIPQARGPARSVPAEAVLADVRRAVVGGRREIVLTGINAGTYSDAGLGLPGLVRRILAQTPVERIRLSSIEPQHVTDELLAVWVDSDGRCLPHFHIPLQSGDDAILRRMGRRYDAASYAGVVARVRREMPAAGVHADVIAGFPGEDDAAWARTLSLLRGLELAGVHVFRFSARPGTPAARMVGQVDSGTKKRRAAEGLALASAARASFAERQIGREARVLFERSLGDGTWLGHAETHLLVSVGSSDGASLENAVGRVRIEAVDPVNSDRVVGRLLQLDRLPAKETLADAPHK